MKNIYQEKWDTRSSIRTSPRKVINFNEAGYFFPPDKQPLLLIPQLKELGEDIKKEILIHSFYKYLSDIVTLETKSIISACNLIVDGNLDIKFPDEMKLNAYTVIIDEYYHVYMARDLIQQLELQYNNLNTLKYPQSDSYSAILAIKNYLDKKYHAIFEILAVCIFETTLVRELVEFFKTPDVHPSIRYYVNDHMNDEAKHYGYFYDLFSFTWNNISTDYQNEIGKCLGHFITLYLNILSEKDFNISLLSFILKDESKSAHLIEDLYKGFEVNAELPIVKNVLQVIKKVGLYNNEFVYQSFEKFNLL